MIKHELRKSWLFSDLEFKDLEKLEELSSVKEFEPGRKIFKVGERAFFLYFIIKGVIILGKHSYQGKRQILKFLGPGEILGEKTVFDQKTYTAFAEVHENAKVIELERRSLLEILKRNPQFSLRIIEKLSQEIKGYQAKLTETSYENTEQRLARFLLRVAGKFGKKREPGLYIGMEFSWDNLAEAIGTSPETVSRKLGEFEKKELIRKENGRIYISNKEELEEIPDLHQLEIIERMQENLL